MRVVDDDAERLAGVDGLEAAGRGRGRPQRAGETAAAGAPSARAAAQAASALETLKRPGSGTRAGNVPSGVTAMKSQPVPSYDVDRAVVRLGARSRT